MKIKIILLLLALYLGSLLLTLPAQQVLRFIPANSGVKIGSASGTIWDGSATQIAYNQRWQLQHLDWKFDWWALLSLQLQLDVQFDNGIHAMSGKGVVSWGLSGISLENVVIDSSAAELIDYAEIAVPVEVEGMVSLVIKNGSQGSPYCQQLDGFVVWKNAAINSELGDVQLDTADLDLGCDNGQLTADLQQQSEHLTSSGQFMLQDQGIYQLQAVAKPGEKLAPAITDLFSWVGPKNAAGETIIEFTGKL